MHTNFDEAFAYLEKHTEVRDVLFSGGDALLFSDDKLEELLRRVRAISHIEFVRIGTRVPIFLPQRITLQLCQMLQKYHPLWMSVHVNHPRELTLEVREALGRLADHGIPLATRVCCLRESTMMSRRCASSFISCCSAASVRITSTNAI